MSGWLLYGKIRYFVFQIHWYHCQKIEISRDCVLWLVSCQRSQHRGMQNSLYSSSSNYLMPNTKETLEPRANAIAISTSTKYMNARHDGSQSNSIKMWYPLIANWITASRVTHEGKFVLHPLQSYASHKIIFVFSSNVKTNLKRDMSRGFIYRYLRYCLIIFQPLYLSAIIRKLVKSNWCLSCLYSLNWCKAVVKFPHYGRSIFLRYQGKMIGGIVIRHQLSFGGSTFYHSFDEIIQRNTSASNQKLRHAMGVGGAVRFLVVGTIGQEERPPRGQLWME